MNVAPRNKLIVSALTLMLITGIGAAALAHGPGPHRDGRDRCGDFERGPEMRLERMAERLDLTADQVQAIEKIREEARAENQELRKQIMRLRNEKRGEMLKDEPATKTVLALTRQIGDIRTELQANRMETRLAVRKLLTPVQRDKMLMFGERQGQRGGRRHGGRDHGGHHSRHGGCGQSASGNRN